MHCIEFYAICIFIVFFEKVEGLHLAKQYVNSEDLSHGYRAVVQQNLSLNDLRPLEFVGNSSLTAFQNGTLEVGLQDVPASTNECKNLTWYLEKLLFSAIEAQSILDTWNQREKNITEIHHICQEDFILTKIVCYTRLIRVSAHSVAEVFVLVCDWLRESKHDLSLVIASLKNCIGMLISSFRH
ncbi:uncharacterized protein LOC111054633 isoform X1 [Nilaparvata lugens]|uniref:uncharacterized protein LOC111054633 isoform X1 n=1 Tax=Nilaparvata lugens TaxID=108931 RepID=UPI00193EAD42|nr:uncharacterized protein LOC111054633 isoform X1 [Nilaparvata lugens]